MGGRAIMPDVVTYLSARAGTPIALPQLAAGVSVEPVRVQKALSTAINSGVYGDALECLHRGRVWVWHGAGSVTSVAPTPPPAPATVAPVPVEPAAPLVPIRPQGLQKGDVVEVMGLTQEGEAVASDGDGRLYRVMPL